ncbi:MAG: acyl-CoA dehydrogenase [Deltaproteobacteria bacterium]|nr:acyl-CoA dehydrogenase [Deltaproteobacteria bacterium]
MQVYKAPLEDIRFNLETFEYDKVNKLPGFEDYDIGTLMDLFAAGDTFAREQMLPLNGSADVEGLGFDPKTGAVTTPKGFKELYKSYCEQGYASLAHDVDLGGSGAPTLTAVVFNEMFVACNKSFTMVGGLSHGLIESLKHYGTDEQKEKYLTKLISGEWTGTMCLTEPQAGTDLGLISTKAIPNDDGSYNLTGTKIWITFGEHDLTDNILHLVLARLPGAPEGSKGISVFLVPKINDDGSVNTITCGGLEHKMGIKASPTCVMNLEDAKGYLVGEPNKGMRAMFVMMNAARLFVGVEGLGMSEIAYQTALEFAKDRRQSRALDAAKQDGDAKADNIMVHPDVRRMLLNIKSTNEGMRALSLWTGTLLDTAHNSKDEEEAKKADDLVALLTPIIKSYMTEKGFLNVSDAMQVCGGAGYTTDWSIEQYMRDIRIAMIYEGTNHIQALDLVGRKLPKGGGELFRTFAGVMGEFLGATKGDEKFAEFHSKLKATSKALNELTMNLGAKGMQDPEEAGAAASNYLNVFALTSLAYVWGRMIHAAQQKEGKFYETKIKTGRFFFEHVLPEVDSLILKTNAGKAAIMDFDVDEF